MIDLILGDCLDKLKEITNNSIDLIIADPPYLTTKEYWDQKEVVDNKLSKEFYRILKATGNFYCWCGIGEKSQSLIRWFPIFSKDFIFKDLITWKKQRGIGMRRGWLYTREEIMWFVKDNKKFIWNKKEQYSTEKYGMLWAKRLKKENPDFVGYVYYSNDHSDGFKVSFQLATSPYAYKNKNAYLFKQNRLADEILGKHVVKNGAGQYPVRKFK